MDLIVAALVLAWVAIVLLAFSLSGILRRINELAADQGRARSQAMGLSIGSSVSRVLQRNGLEGTRMLLFSDPGCASCETIVPLFAEMAQLHNSDLDHAVVSRQSPQSDGHGPFSGELPANVHVVLDVEAFDELGVHLVPLAVALDDHGIVKAVEAVGSESRMREFAASTRAEMIGDSAQV